MSHCSKTNRIRCHYDVLEIQQSADDATIKKAYRKLALKHHPDKNVDNNDNTAEEVANQFRMIQQAYECLSDPQERAWYDDHRHVILKGWTTDKNNNSDNDDEHNNKMPDFIFDVNPFMYAGCYNGFDDNDDNNFFSVYSDVFSKLYDAEINHGGSQEFDIDTGSKINSTYLVREFGASTSEWEMVLHFYQVWESYSTSLNFAWEDLYDMRDAPNRHYRRAMDDENKKVRKKAKKTHNESIIALVRFVKKRDVRVKARSKQKEEEKLAAAERQKEVDKQRRVEAAAAREEWLEQQAIEFAEQEEIDRLRGRIRLADLEDEKDDYEYYSNKKKKGRGKKGKNKGRYSDYESDEIETDTIEYKDCEDNNDVVDFESNDNGDNVEPRYRSDIVSTDDENNYERRHVPNCLEAQNDTKVMEPQPTGTIEPLDEEEVLTSPEMDELDDVDLEKVWRCEVCRKDFKSEGQMENHIRSKKHKDSLKKLVK